jgi:hypothetical protein
MEEPQVLFTNHAKQRLDERNADEAFIASIALDKTAFVRIPSPQDLELSMSTAKDANGKMWTVIHQGPVVVTLRRAHKPEEKRYEEKFQNDKR